MRRDIPIIHIYTVRLEYTRMPTREAVSWTLYYRYDLEKFDKAVYIGTYTRICIPFSSIFFRARVPNSHNLAHWLVIISYTPLLKTIRTHTHTHTHNLWPYFTKSYFSLISCIIFFMNLSDMSGTYQNWSTGRYMSKVKVGRVQYDRVSMSIYIFTDDSDYL